MTSPAIEPDEPDLYLDLRGLKCPLPALKTKSALDKLPAGQILKVMTTDPLAVLDIPHLARLSGNELAYMEPQGDAMVFVLRKLNQHDSKSSAEQAAP